MRFEFAGDIWEVDLLDDGTLDTVISIALVDSNGDAGTSQEVRFSQEFAVEYRNPKTGELTVQGLKELGKEASYTFEE